MGMSGGDMEADSGTAEALLEEPSAVGVDSDEGKLLQPGMAAFHELARERCAEVASPDYVFPQKMSRNDWTVAVVLLIVWLIVLYTGFWW